MLWVGFFNRELEEIPGGDVNPMGNRIRLENISPTKTNSKRIGDRSTQKISGDFLWVKGKQTWKSFWKSHGESCFHPRSFPPKYCLSWGEGGEKVEGKNHWL